MFCFLGGGGDFFKGLWRETVDPPNWVVGLTEPPPSHQAVERVPPAQRVRAAPSDNLPVGPDALRQLERRKPGLPLLPHVGQEALAVQDKEGPHPVGRPHQQAERRRRLQGLRGLYVRDAGRVRESPPSVTPQGPRV